MKARPLPLRARLHSFPGRMASAPSIAPEQQDLQYFTRRPTPNLRSGENCRQGANHDSQRINQASHGTDRKGTRPARHEEPPGDQPASSFIPPRANRIRPPSRTSPGFTGRLTPRPHRMPAGHGWTRINPDGPDYGGAEVGQRQERPRLSAEPPVLVFAARLRDLQACAGSPSVHTLEKLTARAGERVPRATIDEKLGGVSAPKDHQVLAIVAACRKYATESGRELPAETAADDWKAYWISLWDDMQRARSEPPGQRDGTTIAAIRHAVITENDVDAATGSPRLGGLAAATMKRLVTYLTGFHTDQQQQDHLGATLVELDAFIDKHEIVDDQVKILIRKLAEQLDDPFTPVSTRDVLDLRRRLTSYLAS